MKINYFVIIIFISITLKISGQVQNASVDTSGAYQKKMERQKKRFDLIKSITYGGYEFIKPGNLRNGYSLKNDLWAGPTIDINGMFNFGFQQGYLTKQDSGKTINVKGYRMAGGFNFLMPILKYKSFNIVPQLGIGIYGNTALDPQKEYTNKSGTGAGFGFNLNLGVNAIIGPVKVCAKVYGGAGYAQNVSVFNFANITPALSISFSPQEFLMNPKIFSYKGMAVWRENYKSKTNTSFETKSEGNYDVTYEKTTTKETWDNVGGEKSTNISDVRPFLFIGPRVQTNLLNFDKGNFFPSIGANIGLRCGTFFINGIYDAGDFYFKKPEKNYDEKMGRLDGYFQNSKRYGVELGLDLVTYFKKKDFIDQSSFATRTSYFAIILKGGYFMQKNGVANFISDTANATLDHYFKKSGVLNSSETDVRQTPAQTNCFSLGVTASLGAIAFNYDYYWFQKNKPLSHSEFTLSYHYPIIRLFKAAYVFSKEYKYNRVKRQNIKK
jgi:hypothetical protein